MINKIHSPKYYRTTSGFTLLELLIVIAIIGIITLVAVPAYQRYVLETHRKAAIADTLALQQHLEQQYILNNGAYQYLNGETTAAGNAGNCNTVSDYTSGSPPRYRMAIALTDNNQSYTITATVCAATGQTADECGNLRVDNNDLRTVDQDNDGSWAVEHRCF